MSNAFGQMEGVRVVGEKVLYFALKGSVVLLSSRPVDRICMNFICDKELFDTWPIRASSHGWVCASMKRPRVNGAPTPLGCQELWKGTVEVVGNERGDGVLLAIGNDEKVAGSHGIPVVAPTRAWEDSGLRTFQSWCGMLLICGCVHSCHVELAATFVEDEGHVFNQVLILNPSLNRIINRLNEGLQDRCVIGSGRGRHGRRWVGGPVTAREMIKVIFWVVNGRQRVGNVSFNRRWDGRSKWGKGKLGRVNEVVVGGLRAEIVVTGGNTEWFWSGGSRRTRRGRNAMKEWL